MSLRCGDLNWESWAKQVDLDDLQWVFRDEILSDGVFQAGNLRISNKTPFSGSMFVLRGVLLNKP